MHCKYHPSLVVHPTIIQYYVLYLFVNLETFLYVTYVKNAYYLVTDGLLLSGHTTACGNEI